MKQSYTAQYLQELFPLLSRYEAMLLLQNVSTPTLEKLVARVLEYEQTISTLT